MNTHMHIHIQRYIWKYIHTHIHKYIYTYIDMVKPSNVLQTIVTLTQTNKRDTGNRNSDNNS